MLQEIRSLPLESCRDCLVALEVGGFIGGLFAGAISDRLFGELRNKIDDLKIYMGY